MEQNEILEETRRTNELLRGQLLWMRAAAALLAVLLAAVVVCLGNTMNSMGRISAALEGVDLAAVAEQVSKLDMDAVNRAISTAHWTARSARWTYRRSTTPSPN